MPSRATHANDVVLEARDVRSGAVPAHRQKEKKVRYKGVNVNLLGTERPVRGGNAVWHKKNLYQMNRGINQSPFEEKQMTRRINRKGHAIDMEVRSQDEFAVLKAGRNGKKKCTDMESSAVFSDDGVSGVLYSYESAESPESHTGDIIEHLVAQAEAKYENNVLDKLVKTEYEFVDTSESDSDSEFELI